MGFNSGFKGLISFQKCPDQLRHPPSFLFKGARGCLPGSKVDGACVYLSPPASAEVKKEWSYTSSVVGVIGSLAGLSLCWRQKS